MNLSRQKFPLHNNISNLCNRRNLSLCACIFLSHQQQCFGMCDGKKFSFYACVIRCLCNRFSKRGWIFMSSRDDVSGQMMRKNALYSSDCIEVCRSFSVEPQDLNICRLLSLNISETKYIRWSNFAMISNTNWFLWFTFYRVIYELSDAVVVNGAETHVYKLKIRLDMELCNMFTRTNWNELEKSWREKDFGLFDLLLRNFQLY